MYEGPKSFQKAVEELAKLPSIGRRTAQRLALHLLKGKREEVHSLARAVVEMKEKLRPCERCYAYSEEPLCTICQSPTRDSSLLCVVEDPTDLLAIEQSAQFKGYYHVLHGRLSPLDGVGPEKLKIEELIQKLRSQDAPSEIILAMNPDVEGDATALYLARLAEREGIRSSRIAMGIPLGGSLEFTDQITLGRAITERREFHS